MCRKEKIEILRGGLTLWTFSIAFYTFMLVFLILLITNRTFLPTLSCTIDIPIGWYGLQIYWSTLLILMTLGVKMAFGFGDTSAVHILQFINKDLTDWLYSMKSLQVGSTRRIEQIRTEYVWILHFLRHRSSYRTCLQARQCRAEPGCVHPPRHSSWQHWRGSSLQVAFLEMHWKAHTEKS